MPEHDLLELTALERRYGGSGGVADASLHVPAGAIYVLCGANGAGKTTTLRAVAGLLFARKGALRIAGAPVPLDRAARRPGLGFVPDQPLLDDRLTGWQWASFVAGVKGIAWPAHADGVAETLRLGAGTLAQPIRTLSFGNLRKLALWVEMVTTRSLLLLDEPLIGLDPEAIEGFWAAAREFSEGGRAVLLSTHLLTEAEAHATHAGVLHQGRTLFDGPMDELKAGRSLQHAYLDAIRA
jgi:ABC-type multidrug transport system ATPase subunit